MWSSFIFGLLLWKAIAGLSDETAWVLFALHGGAFGRLFAVLLPLYTVLSPLWYYTRCFRAFAIIRSGSSIIRGAFTIIRGRLSTLFPYSFHVYDFTIWYVYYAAVLFASGLQWRHDSKRFIYKKVTALCEFYIIV
jgi:hypothetical protein